MLVFCPHPLIALLLARVAGRVLGFLKFLGRTFLYASIAVAELVLGYPISARWEFVERRRALLGAVHLLKRTHLFREEKVAALSVLFCDAFRLSSVRRLLAIRQVLVKTVVFWSSRRVICKVSGFARTRAPYWPVFFRAEVVKLLLACTFAQALSVVAAIIHERYVVRNGWVPNSLSAAGTDVLLYTSYFLYFINGIRLSIGLECRASVALVNAHVVAG